MPNTEKIEKVAALKEQIADSTAILLTEYRGLSVHDATELRRSLSDQARFSVTKNTLLGRAADQAGIAGLDELLTGPTAVAFVQGDVVATAKRLVDAAKRFPALVLKGGYMEGRVLSGEEARALADLESREVMLSKVAGMMKAEMSRAASMFQALQGRFLSLLEAYKEKVPGAAAESGESEAAPSTEAEVPAPEASTESPARAETETQEAETSEQNTEGEE